MKQLLLDNPDIKSVTATDTPVGGGSGKVLFNVETDQGMVQRGINFAVVDHDFIKALGIKYKDGRDFQRDMPSDTLRSVIVNETFVKRMNWAEPIGKKVDFGDSSQVRARVIGVMKDYHQTGMYNEIESLLLIYRIQTMLCISKWVIRILKKQFKFIETKWKEVFPDQPFSYTFLLERFSGSLRLMKNGVLSLPYSQFWQY